jgi:hypothetical protein
MASGRVGSAADSSRDQTFNSNELYSGENRSDAVADLVQNLEQNLVLNSTAFACSSGFEPGPESPANFLDIDTTYVVLIDQFFCRAAKSRVD